MALLADLLRRSPSLQTQPGAELDPPRPGDLLEGIALFVPRTSPCTPYGGINSDSTLTELEVEGSCLNLNALYTRETTRQRSREEGTVMTTTIHAPDTERSLHVARHEGMELRAVIEGHNVYPEVTDRSGDEGTQFPAWNPIDNVFEFWDREPPAMTALALERAWTEVLNHPALAFAA